MSLLVLCACGTTKEPAAAAKNDASSFEKARVVKSVKAKYTYVRKVCPDCQLLGQALVYNEKKPYDIIKVKKANGEKTSCYFDISEFFGKEFR